MTDGEPSTSSQAIDIATRYRTRQRTSRQPAGGTLSALTSPSSKLDEYYEYCPPRKSQRLAAKNAKDVFKQVRQRGGSAVVPPLTGYLGSIPQEVRKMVVCFCNGNTRVLPIAAAHPIARIFYIYDCAIKLPFVVAFTCGSCNCMQLLFHCLALYLLYVSVLHTNISYSYFCRAWSKS